MGSAQRSSDASESRVQVSDDVLAIFLSLGGFCLVRSVTIRFYVMRWMRRADPRRCVLLR